MRARHSRTSTLTILCLGLLCVPGAAAAQAPPGNQGDDGDADRLPSIEETVEGMDRIDGLFTLYRDKQKLYAFLRADQLGEEFLLATSIARGRFFFGFQWDEKLLAWRRNEKQLMLVQPDVWLRAKAATPIAEAVQRTYTETVIRALPILAEDPKGGVLIDLGKLYRASPEAFFGEIAKTSDSELARLNDVKSFPQNLEVAVDLYTLDKETGYASLMTVHYSLSAIPGTSYRPRLADDRIGYFLTAVKDYSRSPREESRFVRYINRWNLEKADPDLEVSPPKKPIVFYLDKNVPVRYRRYVREGVLEWNRAFERLGIVDALVVRQQTDTNEFASFDPEDVRYNFVRWITTDNTFAAGPSRANPRTGEILDADIIFDDSMIRWLMSDYDILLEEGLKSELAPELRQFLAAKPDRHPGRLLRDRRLLRREQIQKGPGGGPFHTGDQDLTGPFERADLLARGVCTIGRGRAHQFGLAGLAAAELAQAEEETPAAGSADPGTGSAAGKEEKTPGIKWPEELVGEFIKETIMHEVGHTLGLRHNFKASSWRTLASLSGEGEPVEDLSGSVMDYNPLNIDASGEAQGRYLNTTLGPYDYWAIEYGYKPVKASDEEAELPELQKLAARVAEPELAYATDEDVWGSDPLVNRWDLGQDPLEFARSRMTLFHKLTSNLVERAVPEGESYSRLRRAFDALLYDYASVSMLAAGYVGGSYLHRDHRGDPGARDPVVPVPVEKQREALRMVAERVFSDTAFEFPPELLNKLAAGRWWHWGSNDPMLDPDYELHDRVLTLQLWTLFRLINPVTLRHIHDAEMRLPATEDAMTLPELFGLLTRTICAEIVEGDAREAAYTNRQPFISSIRRNLQREYVAELIDIALDQESHYPRAARTLTWDHLRALGEQIDTALDRQGALDDYSASHLRECRGRIQRAVEAQYIIRG